MQAGFIKKALAGALFAVTLFAGTHSVRADDCGAHKVLTLKVRSTGTVWVNFEGASGSYAVCKLGMNYNNVTPEACDGILSLLMAAHLSGKEVARLTGTCAATSDGRIGVDSLILLD